MIVNNIFTVKNQKFYKKEKACMILAQLADYYDPSNFNEKQYIIMDNGLYEKTMNSTSVSYFVEKAKKLEEKGIKVKEIVVPDSFQDGKETISLIKQNIPFIEYYKNSFNFMVVAQGRSFSDFKNTMAFIKKYLYEEKGLENIVVGIPKLSLFDRTSNEAIEEYKKCPYKIHFLGLTSNFNELYKVKDLIRSCDTAHASYLVKDTDGKKLDDEDVLWLSPRKKRSSLDLKKDSVDEEKLKKLMEKLKICVFQKL